MHPECNETKKRGASFEFFNAAMGKLDGKKHLSCAHLFHKRLLKMRVVGKTAATATKKYVFVRQIAKEGGIIPHLQYGVQFNETLMGLLVFALPR